MIHKTSYSSGRLLEFIPCTQTTGKALREDIIGTFAKSSVEISFCHSQTLDGAGSRETWNMWKTCWLCCADNQSFIIISIWHYVKAVK